MYFREEKGGGGRERGENEEERSPERRENEEERSPERGENEEEKSREGVKREVKEGGGMGRERGKRE